MKKLKQLINNVYRICVVNPRGRRSYVGFKEEADSDSDKMSESIIRRIISDDQLQLEADPQLREILRQKVRNIGHQPSPVNNSLLDIFIPLFSAQHIEIKMAVVSLALFVLVGLGPKNNQASDKRVNLFFLADTLGDSSSFHHPAAQDTALRVLYK